MKVPRIVNVISHIDDDLIAASECKKKTTQKSWLKWGSLVACFAVLIIASATILPSFFEKDVDPPDITESRPQVLVPGDESNIEWPWEYKTTYEKYTNIKFDGREYVARAQSISSELLDDMLGTCEAQGIDSYTNKKYTETFDVHKISGVSEEHLVAVGKDGEFYVYLLNSSEKPDTFGVLMETYDVVETLELNKFTKYDSFNELGNFAVNDDEYIWEILSGCQDAKLYNETDSFDRSNRSYLSFIATSEELGAYKKVFYISEDGYVATNVLDYSYIYFIGEEATEKIINYAESNSVEAEFEPYELTIEGTLTEIGDGYVLIDNTILCADKSEGTVYKVLTGDIKIRRYIECTNLKVGDIVAVKYKGTISDSNELEGAYSIRKGIVVDGNLAIPE